VPTTLHERMTRGSPWPLIWPLAIFLLVAWPPAEGRSLAVKAVNWLADPAGRLPHRPVPLAMGVDDDADAVTAHDLEENAYETLYDRSATMRLRLWLKDAQDPLDPSTERQVLVAIAVLGGLWIWQRSVKA